MFRKILRTVIMIAGAAYILCYFGLAAGMLFADYTKNPNAYRTRSAEEIAATYDPLVEDVPTVEQAYALLEVQIKKDEARKREAALMKPITNKDCFNKMSPAEQVRRINEILNTPNAPDEVGRH